MNTREKLPIESPSIKIDSDLITCPLSLQIIRHPILVSDGYHYELNELCKLLFHNPCNNPLSSPITKEMLTAFTYDTHLKSSLDETYGEKHPDRYESYEKEPGLTQLKNRLEGQKNAWKISLNKSIFLGGLVGSATFLLLLEHLTEAPLPTTSYALNLAFLSGLSDYLCRHLSQHQFGLFGALHKMAFSYVRARMDDLMPEEMQQDHHHDNDLLIAMVVTL